MQKHLLEQILIVFHFARVENYTQLNMQLPGYLYKHSPPSSLSDGQNLNELTSLC